MNHKAEFAIRTLAPETTYTLTSTTTVDDGSWHQLVGLRTGSTLQLYVDGVLEGTIAADNKPIGPVGNPLTIGSLAGIFEFFNGVIDEVAIFSRALSGSEISTLYQAQTMRTRLSAWDNNSRIGEGNVLLAHLDEASGPLKDGSVYGHDGTASGALYAQSGVVGNAMYFDGVDDYVDFGDSPVHEMTSRMSAAIWVKPLSRAATNEDIIFARDGEYQMAIKPSGDLVYVMNASSPGFTWVSTGFTVPLSAWTHLGITYNATSGAIRVYANGKLVYSYTGSGNIGDYDAGAHERLRIGKRNHLASEPFHGYLDEFAVWNRDLNATEFASLYDMQKPGRQGNVQELPNFRLTDGFVDMTSNVMLMHLNEESATEGRSVLDFSGYSNNGTLLTGSDGLNKSVAGQLRGALTFDGSDAIKITDADSLRLANITFGAWFKWDGSGSTPNILAKSLTGTANSYALYISSGNLYAHVDGIDSDPFKLTPNVWYYALATHSNGGSLILYVNGQAVSTKAAAITKTYDASPVFIGADDSNDDGLPDLNFTGQIDEAAIWGRVLAAAEIARIYDMQESAYQSVFESRPIDATGSVNWTGLTMTYQHPYEALPDNNATSLMHRNELLYHMDEASGTLNDASINSHTGTPTNGPIYGTPGVAGNALTFDGIDDYVALPNGFADFTGGLTFSVWAYPTAMKSGGRFIELGSGPSNLNIIFGRMASTNQVYFCVVGGGVWNVATGGASDIVLNVWQHFAVTMDAAGNVVIYKNGVALSTGTVLVPSNSTRTSNKLALSSWGADLKYAGHMDEVGIWSRALSAAEIKKLYRGSGRIRYQVRSCDDAACSAEKWQGVDGPNGGVVDDFNLLGSQSHGSIFSSFANMSIAAKRYFQYRLLLGSESTTSQIKVTNVTVNPTPHYAQLGQVVVNTGIAYSSLVSFVETLGSGDGDVTYQISKDGTNWFYHNGTTWLAASTRAQANSASAVNAAIGSFTGAVGSGTFYFKAFLNSSSGESQIELDNVRVGYVP